MKDEIKDPRYPKDVFGKFEYTHKGPNDITFHYWKNLINGEIHGIKYK